MVKWSKEDERRLLLAIIAVLDTKPPNWEDVVKKMGPSYTTEAVRQKYQGLRRGAEAEFATAVNGSSEGTPVAAPISRKRKPKTANSNGDGLHSAIGTSRKRIANSGGMIKQEPVEDDDEPGSPTLKKIKVQEVTPTFEEGA